MPRIAPDIIVHVSERLRTPANHVQSIALIVRSWVVSLPGLKLNVAGLNVINSATAAAPSGEKNSRPSRYAGMIEIAHSNVSRMLNFHAVAIGASGTSGPTSSDQRSNI